MLICIVLSNIIEEIGVDGLLKRGKISPYRENQVGNFKA